MEIIKTKDYNEMSKVAAGFIASTITLYGNPVLGLATGSTPIGAYQQLVKKCKNGDISFKDVISINLDEYVGLSEKHNQSYRYFMNTNLFNSVDIDKKNTYVPSGNAKDLKKECKRYDSIIENFGGIDLQLLGLGQNGHIGFNEPSDSFSYGTHVVTLTESTIEANKRFFKSVKDVPRQAITMGIDPILNANMVLMVASGKNKKEAVKALVKGPITPQCPASILRYHKNFILVVDKEAASLI